MAIPQQTAGQIIQTFELQVNDVTELSSTEELALLNRVYQRLCSSRPWIFLRAVATGTLSTDSQGSYITIPSDFLYFVENNQSTDNTLSPQTNAAPKAVLLIDSNGDYIPWQIVNFTDRRQYVNTGNVCYYDPTQGKVRFPVVPTLTSYEFDYCKIPPNLTSSDYPLIPGNFHDMLAYAMAVENDILQLSEKARSYAAENNAKFQTDLSNLIYWDSQQYFN